MIDYEALLQPILGKGDTPAGEDLAFSQFYDAISEVRREDDQAATEGIWAVEPKRANWDQVIELSIEGLTERSKDLQLTMWLAEALLHRDSIAGLTDGLGLASRLCETFWDTLYPRIEEGDVDARLSHLIALENRVVPALMQVPLTVADPQSGKEYTLQHLISAQRIEPLAASNPKSYKAAIASGDIAVGTVMAVAARTPVDFYRQLHGDVRACQAALRELDQVFAARSDGNGPGFTKMNGLLIEMQKAIGRLGAGRLAFDEAADAAETAREERDAEGPEMAEAASVRSGGIASREQAYRCLDDAANYLLATEPHSPVPYLIKRAIRWGNLPLGSLLSELLEDDERTKRLFRLLSIPS
jgi:type VI secretion system ImpA family protein